MKPVIIAFCIFFLGRCPFIPPSKFQHVAYNAYPESYISLPVGESMQEIEESSRPGSQDIVGVSSTLTGETLTATFYLRELPDGVQWAQDLGHMQDFKVQWIVVVEVEGDSATPYKWHDYELKATYYDPVEARTNLGKALPTHPWVYTIIWQCAPGIHTDSGRQYNKCTEMAQTVDLSFSYEENSLTLSADIPGISDTSTIAFWVWGMGMMGGAPDHTP